MAWYHRLINLGRSDRLAAEIQREMDFHLAERADDLRAAGLSERAATHEARRRFGNRSLVGEQIRETDLMTWAESAIGDIRYAFRTQRRSPLFAIVAVGSIALGIGATTAVFTLIDAVALRPLPVRHPEELLQL